MDFIDTLLGRVSVSALREPAPQGAVLERILSTALRAPDHGRLVPQRFVLIQGDARARLADVVEQALRAREPDATVPMIEKQRGKFLRAPLVLALGARVRASHKIPEIEQLMTAAAGAMNLLNALHAEGFGGIWVTGANANDPAVQQALGFGGETRMLGFLFVGTPENPPAPVPRAPLAGCLAEWTGEPVRWGADG